MARMFPTDVPRNVLSKYGELGRKVIELWEEVRKYAQSDPKPHHLTHMVGGTDQFPKPPVPLDVHVGGTADQGDGPGFMRQDAQLRTATGIPSGLANANTEGTSTSAPRLDHQHKRDIRVKVDGADVGTRNAIDFRSGPGFTVTAVDDIDDDAVGVTIVARGVESAFFTSPGDDFFPIPDPPFFTGG